MNLFDKTAFDCSKIITQNYSTSFSLGIKMLDKKFHESIYAIYGFVRFADEIVDTFHDFDKKHLLEEFKEVTFRAINQKISLNPVLQAFQITVNTYQIDHDLINAFLHSMEMDLYQQTYDDSSYTTYIYGSAEVVGLMCLQVFCEGNKQQYNSLKEYAQKLGAAFQKVNFLRDLKSDFDERGRTYFPNVDFNDFTIDAKKLIENDIQHDFDIAYQGILKLPIGAKKGVYLAYSYYLKLFDKIKKLPAQQIQQERIRVKDSVKLALLAKTYLFL